MSDIYLLGATYPDVPAVDLPKSGGGTARFFEATDGNSLAYGSSSCLVGTATVGTGYAWTTVSGTVLEINHGAVDSTVVA